MHNHAIDRTKRQFRLEERTGREIAELQFQIKKKKSRVRCLDYLIVPVQVDRNIARKILSMIAKFSSGVTKQHHSNGNILQPADAAVMTN